MADVAVIGMSCRFPGEATSPEKLWKMLMARKTAWSEFPTDRMNMDGFYHPDGHRQGSISFRGAHFLQDDIAAFDASFFSMNEDDVCAMDPQQRLLLETSYEAIENAGLLMEDLKGSNTSVYVGSFVRDYEQVSLRDMDYQPQYAATGTGMAIMSNRISYFYDLRGESITIDTGCSGSLVAVHHACQSLVSGASSIAFAAGAGIILTPNTMMPMTALNFLSPDGKCFTFDARANGYGRGEGVGFVVLKKLSDALRDNDPIRAVIKATHVNQDGRTAGITLPRKMAQVDNIRSVYRQAGLDFSQTGYVECHGTGTKAGDLTELTAVAETIASGRGAGEVLLVGSIKPNIGHLEGAAGIAGVIKAVLAAENAEIPPNANFEIGNPEIDFDAWKLKVPTQPHPWPVSGLRRVSVNCFGFGGTNAHAVVDEGAYYVKRHRSETSSAVVRPRTTTEKTDSKAWHTNNKTKPQLLVLSSPDQQGLLRVVRTLAQHLRCSSSCLSQKDLDNLAYTLGCRRSKFEWKTHFVASSRAEILEKLDLIQRRHGIARFKMNATNANSQVQALCKVALIFCGQGAQWATMGQDLMCFTAYRESIHAAEAYLRDARGFQLNLVEELARDPSTSCVKRPHISQPATTALQVALVDLLRACGIKPRSVVGHSSGEIAAAYASEMIDRETAWAVAYYRGLCVTRVGSGPTSQAGSMCVLAMSEDQARDFLSRTNKHSTIQVACLNSPRCVTLSGNRDDIQWIVSQARSEGFLGRELSVEVAYHSSHMLSVAPEYLAHLQDKMESAGNTPIPTAEMFSSVTGGRISPRELGSPRYWADNLVSPVLFSHAVQTMISETRPDVVLEISPHTTLKGIIEENINTMSIKPRPVYVPVMERRGNATYTILEACGSLWTRGYPVNMEAVIKKGSLHDVFLETLTNLPSYPWDHGKKYWHESPLTMDYRFREFGRRDLIGAPTPDSLPQEPRWRGFLRVAENPWLRDHQVQKTIVYPAAGIITMVIEGTRQKVPRDANPSGFSITNLHIENPMVIPETAYGLEVCLNMKLLSPEVSRGISFDWAIYGRALNGQWTRHAHGCVEARLCSSEYPPETGTSRGEAFQKTKANATKLVEPKHLYDMLDMLGMNYGPSFRNIKSVSKGDKQCVGTVVIPNTKSVMPRHFEFDHIIHPATLDAVFQLLFVIDDRPMVPTSIYSLYVSADMAQGAGNEIFGYASAARSGLRGAEAAISMTTVDWDHPSIIIDGLRMTALTTSDYIPDYRTLCTEIQWKEDTCSASVHQSEFRELLCLLAHKYPGLAILQRGGDHHLGKYILNCVSSADGYAPRLSRYSLSDANPQALDHLRAAFLRSPIRNFLEERTIQSDADQNPQYHVIISRKAKEDDEFLKKLLLPDGFLLLERGRRNSVKCAEKENGSACLSGSWGHRARLLAVTYDADHRAKATIIFNAQQITHARVSHRAPAILLVLPDHPNEEVEMLAQALHSLLKDRHLQVEITHLRLLGGQRCVQASRKVVVSLLDLDYTKHFVWNWTREQFDFFRSVYKAAEAVLWVTRGANRRPTIPRNSPIIGLARTLMSEDPGKAIVTFDLDETTRIPDAGWSIFFALDRSIINPPQVGPREAEYAEERGRIFIPRIVPVRALNNLIEDTISSTSHSGVSFLGGEVKELLVVPPGEQFGECENFKYIHRMDAGDLSPDEVELRFSGSVLHHEDWQTITGQSPRTTMGMDLMGTVTRVGANSNGIYPNDDAVSLVQRGSLTNQHRVGQRFVKKISGGLRMCVPSAWILAYYSLYMRCCLRRGQRILVLGGASIYGQAAIQIAQLRDAEVFSTISGPNSDSQRQVLEGVFGLDDGHVENHDDLDWDTKLLSKSKGQWMDVVYVPTSDCLDGMEERVVKATGTLIYLGDHSDRSLRTISSRRSILRLDLAELLAEDPDPIADVFNHVEEIHLKKGHAIKPTQLIDEFSLSQLPHALRCLKAPASAALVTADRETTIPLARRTHMKSLRDSIDGGTYVLAGGLGGLGRSIAQLLVDNGAGNLVFLSRSATRSDEASTFMASLEEQGVTAKHFAVDISDATALQGLYFKEILPHMPRVSGVVQCAAVLQDALFDNMQYEAWQKVMAPKGQGTFNLVDTFGRDRSLGSDSGSDPWFIFLSSSAGIIGNRGQANYSAGNVFMDALARSGTITGRAVSLDVGPVLDVGMVAENQETMKKLRNSGFYGIRHQDLLKMVERAIVGEIHDGEAMPTQVVLGIGTGGLIRQNRPADPYWSRTAAYSYLNLVDMPPPDLGVFGSDASAAGAGAGAGATTLKAQVASCSSAAEASHLICQALKRELAARLSTVKAEDIDEGSCPKEYGIDSLLAVRIRVWALEDVGAGISVFDILGDNTILELAGRMADQVLAKEE